MRSPGRFPPKLSYNCYLCRSYQTDGTTMNKLLFYFSNACFFFFSQLAGAQISVPAASPSASVTQAVGLGEVRIEYGRPALKGRKMFGHQVPYNAVWRTGANKTTQFILSKPMEINGRLLPAGSYGLFTIPAPDEWTIILSKDAKAWGAYTYNPDNDVLRFKVKASKLATPEEFFTIAFDAFSPTHATLAIRWENTQVSFDVRQDADKEVMDEINRSMAAADINSATYIQAAGYYLDTGRDLSKAYEWASKALETNKAFWVYYLRARIAAKIGKCDVALKDTEAGLPLAKTANDPAYVLYFEQLKKDCAGK